MSLFFEITKPNRLILLPLSILREHVLVSFAPLRVPCATIAPYSPGINVSSNILTDDRKISVHSVFSFCFLRSSISNDV